VTFFGVFLLFISHISLIRKLNISKLFWYLIAIVCVLISKSVLLLPYSLFVFIDLVFIHRSKWNFKYIIFIGIGFLSAFFILTSLFEIVNVYIDETSKTGAATFSFLINIPIIGWVVKYVYALLSPFPWAQSIYFISYDYAGNWLLFIMHILSALVGTLLFVTLFSNSKKILASSIEFKQMIAFPVIMSTSILGGGIGFHTYILIYFPMMAPILTESNFKKNPVLVLLLVFFLELFVDLAK
jgi:hypothetical protein